MCQISSLMATVEGSNFQVWQILSKGKGNRILMSFPKIVNQMGSFGEKRKKNMFFCFCRPILDIFGFPLLSVSPFVNKHLILSDVHKPSSVSILLW